MVAIKHSGIKKINEKYLIYGKEKDLSDTLNQINILLMNRSKTTQGCNFMKVKFIKENKTLKRILNNFIDDIKAIGNKENITITWDKEGFNVDSKVVIPNEKKIINIL